jgi:hypothetical protein
MQIEFSEGQKATCRVALLIALVVFFALQAIGQDNSDWSDWKPTPNFPGIKIRVLCETNPTTGNGQWSYQFLNTYSHKVYLVYQDEAVNSTGNPPTFSPIGGHYQNSGEKSDVYTDYLHGSCDTRKTLYIRVVSIKDDQGNQMQPKAGSSRSSAFGGRGTVKSAASSSSQSGPSGGAQSGAAIANGGASPGQNAAETAVSLTGTTWRCTTTVSPNDGHAHYLITFNPDKTVKQSEWDLYGDAMAGEWIQNGTAVKWTTHPGSNYWMDMQISGNRMSGREASSESLSLVTTAVCNLQAP